MNRIVDDGEVFLYLLWVALALALYVVFSFFTADRMVRCYYLSGTYSQTQPIYQIMADVDWADDSLAYISADRKEVLAVYAQLPQCKKK